MNSILRRRLAMMGVNKNDIIYKLENYAFDGGFLNTGIVLLDEDKDFTITYDVTLETNPTSGNGSTYRLLRIISESGNSYSLSVGKSKGTVSKYTFHYMEHYPESGIGTVGTGRQRFVIYHAKNSGSCTLKIRKDSGTVETDTETVAFTASSKNLVLGQTSGTNQLPKGTINKCIIYNRVLSDAEINSFLGVS